MLKRININIRGAVQGVGFRPFVYRLAKSLKLSGCVYNNSEGVHIEVEGNIKDLERFILKIENEKPKLAKIMGMEFSYIEPHGYKKFNIIKSKNNTENTTLILPDIAVCEDCLNEMNDANDRRYRYPFINCTNCGPRFSIIESLPYDRPNTSMKTFKMCEDCRNEYENPLDRRFHAQPIACPKCGPTLELWKSDLQQKITGNEVISVAASLIKDGKIIALKGLGGYQLLVDAKNNLPVKVLRKRKQRDEKPFALMFPSLDQINKVCHVSDLESRLLKSPESPIVLLKKKSVSNLSISEFIAYGNPYLGIMLPYTPMHHLLLQEIKRPIVATSGNISEQPMCINENDALEQLGKIADYFLVHNRPIVRPVDDSIVRIIKNSEAVLRRARGYAPLPISISSTDGNALAVGAHLKNNITLLVKENSFVSQHIGDLSSEPAFNNFVNVIKDFENLYNVKPSTILHDMHPDYLSSKYAKSSYSNLHPVQHHVAHIASCRAENGIKGPVLGVSFDGTGFGLDGTIWGGEFFIMDDIQFRHIAQFKKFLLPGGELAIKESRRSALGVLWELFGQKLFKKNNLIKEMGFSQNEVTILKSMLLNKLNSPSTSSVGRLFDAVSSILNISHVSNFEGQSAMKLEFIADEEEYGAYPFELKENKKIIVNWVSLIKNIIEDKSRAIDNSVISSKFHNTIAEIILQVAKIVEEKKVVLSGGCFQNIFLVNRTLQLLEANNFNVFIHQRIPPNDGGISFGQIAAMKLKRAEFDVASLKAEIV